jgi:hypothetical protein
VLRAVFFGDGRAVRLRAKLRNERETGQRLERRLDGDLLEAMDVERRSDWIAVNRRTSTKPGLNELTIAFARTFGPVDERYWFRIPGLVRDHVEGERTGVVFQRLQVVTEP